jgi:beta-N-acetylhexosaminidase
LFALGKPVILVSMMNPYDLRYFPTADTVLATYGLTSAAMSAAARLMFGEIKPQGRLPVTIPGFFPRGSGLQGFQE